jgi:hypothetical protein
VVAGIIFSSFRLEPYTYNTVVYGSKLFGNFLRFVVLPKRRKIFSSMNNTLEYDEMKANLTRN